MRTGNSSYCLPKRKRSVPFPTLRATCMATKVQQNIETVLMAKRKSPWLVRFRPSEGVSRLCLIKNFFRHNHVGIVFVDVYLFLHLLANTISLVPLVPWLAYLETLLATPFGSFMPFSCTFEESVVSLLSDKDSFSSGVGRRSDRPSWVSAKRFSEPLDDDEFLL